MYADSGVSFSVHDKIGNVGWMEMLILPSIRMMSTVLVH